MTLGFIGTGQMGFPMCGHLLDAGHPVVVCDTNADAVKPLAERQARVARSAKAVADAAEIVFASLPTLDAYRAVAVGDDGVIAGSAAKMFVNLGTVGGRFIQDIAAELAERGIATIDCPISGGPAGAAAGTLSVMASGPPEEFAKVKPYLELFGTITYAGEQAGMAQSLKLVNNILTATALAATSEAMVMGVKAGLDPETILQAVNIGSGRNSATLEKFPAEVVTHRYSFGAALDIICKDVDLALGEGEALGVPMQVGQSVRQFLRLARAVNGGQADITTVAKLVGQWAGKEIPKTR
jgi:3-hydroxyisobutyrate dehydrogenase-like beta-hydroxyacid dehydrogenase